MQIAILDATGQQQTVLVKSIEAPVDHSGAIQETGVSQLLIDANLLRSGWVMQNRSNNPMFVNDLGNASVAAGSFSVPAGGFFPPAGYPVTTGAIQITGTIGDTYTAREW